MNDDSLDLDVGDDITVMSYSRHSRSRDGFPYARPAITKIIRVTPKLAITESGHRYDRKTGRPYGDPGRYFATRTTDADRAEVARVQALEALARLRDTIARRPPPHDPAALIAALRDVLALFPADEPTP